MIQQHRLTDSLVVAAVEDRKVCSRGSEELQSLGSKSDHDSQQLPGAKMVRNFLLGDGDGDVEDGFFPGRPRKASLDTTHRLTRSLVVAAVED